MNARELNRDVKRLLKKEQYIRTLEIDEIYRSEGHMKAEINRLYHADNTLKALTKDNLLILLRINLRYRAIPLHMFGLHVEIGI